MYNIEFIKQDDNKLGLKSPFNQRLVNYVKRQLKAKWNGHVWIFDERDLPRVIKKCKEFYYCDFDANDKQILSDTIDITVNLDEFDFYDCFILFGITYIKKNDRDSYPFIADSVVIIEGNIPTRGGSRANPSISQEEGTIIEIRDIPENIVQNYITRNGNKGLILPNITESKDNNIEKLKEEKIELEKRLKEINKLLEEE